MSNCTYNPGAKPGKKHALNIELRILTNVYGILVSVFEVSSKQSKEQCLYIAS